MGKISEGEEALELSIAWVIQKFGTIMTKGGQRESQGSKCMSVSDGKVATGWQEEVVEGGKSEFKGTGPFRGENKSDCY